LPHRRFLDAARERESWLLLSLVVVHGILTGRFFNRQFLPPCSGYLLPALAISREDMRRCIGGDAVAEGGKSAQSWMRLRKDFMRLWMDWGCAVRLETAFIVDIAPFATRAFVRFGKATLDDASTNVTMWTATGLAAIFHGALMIDRCGKPAIFVSGGTSQGPTTAVGTTGIDGIINSTVTAEVPEAAVVVVKALGFGVTEKEAETAPDGTAGEAVGASTSDDATMPAATEWPMFVGAAGGEIRWSSFKKYVPCVSAMA